MDLTETDIFLRLGAATVGIACGLAAWKVAGAGVVVTLVLLAGVGWIERVLGLGEWQKT